MQEKVLDVMSVCSFSPILKKLSKKKLKAIYLSTLLSYEKDKKTFGMMLDVMTRKILSTEENHKEIKEIAKKAKKGDYEYLQEYIKGILIWNFLKIDWEKQTQKWFEQGLIETKPVFDSLTVEIVINDDEAVNVIKNSVIDVSFTPVFIFSFKESVDA